MQKMTKQWKIALLPCKSFVIRGYTGRKTNRTITYKMVRWVFRPPTPHETTKDKTHLSTTTRSLPRRPVGSPSSGVKLKNSQLSGHIVGAAHLAFRFTLQMYHHFHQWLWLKAYRLVTRADTPWAKATDGNGDTLERWIWSNVSQQISIQKNTTSIVLARSCTAANSQTYDISLEKSSRNCRNSTWQFRDIPGPHFPRYLDHCLQLMCLCPGEFPSLKRLVACWWMLHLWKIPFPHAFWAPKPSLKTKKQGRKIACCVNSPSSKETHIALSLSARGPTAQPSLP